MQVRKVRKEDTVDLIELMKEYYKFYNVTAPNDKKIARLIETLIEDETKGIQFLVIIDGKPKGFVTLYKIMSTMTCEEIILMNDLYVAPEQRGSGIGKMLFEMAKKYTFSNGFGKLEWMTEPSNARARKFYDKMGGKWSEWIYYTLSNVDGIDCIY